MTALIATMSAVTLLKNIGINETTSLTLNRLTERSGVGWLWWCQCGGSGSVEIIQSSLVVSETIS